MKESVAAMQRALGWSGMVRQRSKYRNSLFPLRSLTEERELWANVRRGKRTSRCSPRTPVCSASNLREIHES